MKSYFFLLIFLCVSCFEKNTDIDRLNNAANNPFRKDSNKIRDKYRNPIDTLTFFEISRDKKILEIVPGSGWYSEIISHYMKNTKNFTVAIYDKPPVKILNKIQDEFINYFSLNKDNFGEINVIKIDNNYELKDNKEKYDLVLTFRNTHNWLDSGNAKKLYKSVNKILNKGGVLGVVQHRANENSELNFKKGYVKESYLINLIEKQGFELLEKSEINSNSKDLKNYKKGVWTLPPRLVEGENNKVKYLEIGESDRMTLKFIKK